MQRACSRSAWQAGEHLEVADIARARELWRWQVRVLSAAGLVMLAEQRPHVRIPAQHQLVEVSCKRFARSLLDEPLAAAKRDS
jgi:hypothetical protein